jgi:hypothetical protein
VFRLLIGVGGLALLLLCGCGGSSDSSPEPVGSYPAQVEQNYLTNCQSSAQASSGSSRDFSDYCHCVLTKIEAKQSFEEFKAAEEQVREKIVIPKLWRQSIISCRDEIQSG